MCIPTGVKISFPADRGFFLTSRSVSPPVMPGKKSRVDGADWQRVFDVVCGNGRRSVKFRFAPKRFWRRFCGKS